MNRLDFVTPEEKEARLASWHNSPRSSYIKEHKLFFDINLKSPEQLATYAQEHPEFVILLTDSIRSGHTEMSDIERSSFRRLRQTWTNNVPESVKRNFSFVREVYHNIVLWKPLADHLKRIIPPQSGVRPTCILDDNGDLLLEVIVKGDERMMENVKRQLEDNEELILFLGAPRFSIHNRAVT